MLRKCALLGCSGLLLFLVWGCTSSPVGEQTIDGGNNSIQGTVQLSNNLAPDDVYVWLEGFNLGTRTDEQGNFQFILPPSAAQGNADGVTGAFNLYFFVENFLLRHTEVFTRKGSFVYSTDTVDEEGRLRSPMFMVRRLKTTVALTPAEFSNRNLATTRALLRVDVELSTETDTVVVFFPGLANDIFGPLLFRNIDTGEITVRSSQIAGLVNSAIDTVTNRQPIQRTMVLEVMPDEFEPGQYEVIPYLLVKDQVIPGGLLKSIGENIETFGPNYLRLPFKREGDNRVVTITE